MEEQNIEQPVMDTSEEVELSDESPEGSILGKFKDSKTLLEAYNNLQSEFTRKSQKLAELQKNLRNLRKLRVMTALMNF